MPRCAEPRAWPTKPTRIGVLFVYPCRGGGAAPAHDMRRPWGWSKVCLSPDSCASTINNALQSEVSRPGANCVCASSVVNDRPPCEHRYVFWGCIVRCLSGTHVHTVALPYRLLGTSEFCCLLVRGDRPGPSVSRSGPDERSDPAGLAAIGARGSPSLSRARPRAAIDGTESERDLYAPPHRPFANNLAPWRIQISSYSMASTKFCREKASGNM